MITIIIMMTMITRIIMTTMFILPNLHLGYEPVDDLDNHIYQYLYPGFYSWEVMMTMIIMMTTIHFILVMSQEIIMMTKFFIVFFLVMILGMIMMTMFILIFILTRG